MKRFVSVILSCLTIMFVFTSVEGKSKGKPKGPAGPYKKYTAELASIKKSLDKENAKKRPNARTLTKLDEKAAKCNATIDEKHAKNKEKYLDKKIAAEILKKTALEAKGKDTESIDKKIAKIEASFQEKYGQFYDGGEKKPKKKTKEE